MFLIVLLLYLTAPLCLVQRFLHRVRHLICIHDHMAFCISGRPSYGLDQGCLRTEESFLVRIQDSHQLNLRNIQPLTEQVDSHQHIKYIQTHIPDDLWTLQCVNIWMQIPYPYPHFFEILCKILCHALGQGSNQHFSFFLYNLTNLTQQIIYLSFYRSYIHFRIQQPCGPEDLLYSHQFMTLLIVWRCGWHK